MPDWSELDPFSEEKRFTRAIKRRRIHKAAYEDQGISEPQGTDLIGPSSLTTRYLTKGIPDVARRTEQTGQFVKDMMNVNPSWENMAKMFSERFPRVAAHMNVQKILPDAANVAAGARGAGGNPSATTNLLVGRSVPNKMDVRIHPHSPDPKRSLVHESTHVAQRLGNPNTRDMYNLSSQGLKELGASPQDAYRYIPHEVSARVTADRKLGAGLAPFSALKDYEEIANYLPLGSPTREAMEKLMRWKK
jgi:hypothetical protein